MPRLTWLSTGGEVSVDAVPRGKVARQHRRPARRTHAAGDGELVELGTFRGEAIDDWAS